MLLSKIRKQTILIMYIFLGIFVIGGIYGLFGTNMLGDTPQNQAKPSKLPTVVAHVGQTPIPYKLFDIAYLRYRQQMEMLYGRIPSNYDTQMLLKAQTAQMLVNQQILIDHAREFRAAVSSAELAKAMRTERDRYVGLPERRSEDSSIQGRFRAYNADQKKDREFADILAQMGMSTTEYKDYVRRGLLEEKVRKAIVDAGRKGEEQKIAQRAEEVLKKVKAGEDFSILASQYSDDPSSKSVGGDTGWLARGTLDPEVESAAFSIQPGQTSPIIKTANALYIIQVLGQKIALGPDFEASKPALTAEIRAAKNDPKAQVTDEEVKNRYEQVHLRQIKFAFRDEREIVGEWLKNIHSKIKVTYDDPEIVAFRYYTGSDPRPGEKSPDLKHALDLYRKASLRYPDSEFLEFKMGSIYERMADEALGNVADDPYAKFANATEVKGTKGKPASKREKRALEFRKAALENYERAFAIADDKKRYDVSFYLAIARTAKTLGDVKKARKFYEESVIFAADNMNNLSEVRAGLLATNASKKKIQEVDDMTLELQKEMDEAQKEAAKTPPPQSPQ